MEVETKNLIKDLKVLHPNAKAIYIHYSGSGDSGYIDDIYGYDDKNQRISVNREPLDLEEWAYDILEEHYGGWEINDGSTGEIEIDCIMEKAILRHSWFETITNNEPELEL